MGDLDSSVPTTPSSGIVRYDNAINAAIVRLSAIELRIALLAITRIPPKEQISANSVHYVSVTDMCSMGMTPGNAYTALQDAAKSLRAKAILVQEKDLLRKGVQLDAKGLLGAEDGYWEFSLVKAIHYVKSKGCIGLVFNDFALPFISDLRRNYTQWCLYDLAGVTSAYAIRLYGILMQWKGTGTFVVRLDELRNMLGVEPDKLERYTSFKSRVISVAVRAINEAPYTTLQIDEVEEVKVGRKVGQLIFHFSKRVARAAQEFALKNSPQDNLLLTVEEATLSEKQIEMFADWLSGKTKSKEYSASEFFKWLEEHGYTKMAALAAAARPAIAKSFRHLLRNPKFVIDAYPWLYKAGARLKRRTEAK